MKKFLPLILTLLFGVLGVTDLLGQINTGGTPKLKFGANVAYKNGVLPTNLPTGGTYGTSQAAADAYNAWKTAYVSSCSNGTQYRVLFDDYSSTVSEGIGYGMLVAVYAADKALFDGLWAYYKANTNGNVMNWKISGCSGVSGSNGATDAELDVAMALVIASEQWSATTGNTYSADALSMIQKIKNLEMTTDGQTLNGDAWGNTNSCRNPSYFAPAYYTEFAKFDAANATFWSTSAINASNTLLTANRNSTSGLVSNWCDNSGTENACGNTGSGGYGYGADACRNPWRMAVDYLWHGSSASTAAKDINAKLITFVNGYESQLKGPFSSRSISNPSSGSYVNGSYTTLALPTMTSTASQASLNKCYTNIVNLSNTDVYFNSTMRLLTLFTMTGNFWAPGASGFVFPPSILTGVTNSTGTQIILTANKSLTTATPAASNFTVYYNGTAQSSIVSSVAVSGTTITLTLSTAPQPGQTISVTYSGSGSITSADGATMAAFTQFSVLNMLEGNETILDDCDDGNEYNNVGGVWFTFNDKKDQAAACKAGTVSTITPLSSAASPFRMTSPGYNSTAYAVNATYTLGTNYTPYNSGACASWTNPAYVGIGTWVDDVETNTMDWSSGTGVSFYYKGPATAFQVIIKEVTDYCYHQYKLPATSDWTKYTILWTQLAQPTWGTQVTFTAKNVLKLQWQFGTDVVGTALTNIPFWIDDIRIMNMPPVTLTATTIQVKSTSKITNPLALTTTSTDTLKLEAVPTPATASYPVVFWSSSDTTVVKIDYQGNVFVKGYGRAIITARAKMHQNVTDTMLVMVPAPVVPPTAISFTETKDTVYVGNSLSLQDLVKFTPTTTNATGLTWTSSNTNYATVTTSSGLVSGVAAGTVTITATSTAATTVKNTIIVVVLASCTAPTVTITPSATSICAGGSVTLTAAGASTYAWSTASTNAAITVSPTAATTYTVTGTSATGGCTATASQIITVNPVPTVTISSTKDAVCDRSSATLTADGASTYAWSTAESTSVITVTPITETTYTVTGTASGCTATATKTILFNTNPSVKIAATNSAVCSGKSTTLTASGASTYSWSNTLGTTASVSVNPTVLTTYSVTGTDANNCTGTASSSISVLQPTAGSETKTACGSYTWNGTVYNATGAYTKTLTGINGCDSVATLNLTITAGPTVSIAASKTEICAGASATLTAKGATSYTWNDQTTDATKTVTPASTTTYTVTADGGTGCTTTSTVTITVNPLPTVIVTPSSATICEGNTQSFVASGASSYAWATSATETLLASTAGTYTVTGTDAKGCVNTASASLVVTAKPVVTISASADAVCSGKSVTLTASAVGTGITYAWSNSTSGAITTVTVTPTVANLYTVTATSGTCTGTATKTIGVSVPTSSTLTKTECGSYTLNGSTYQTSGTYTQVIQNIAGCDSTITLNLTIANPASTITQTACGSFTLNGTAYDQSGTYTQVVKTTSGCDSTITLNLTINALPTVGITASTKTVCKGSVATLTASGTATSYKWDNLLTTTAIDVTPAVATTYSVTGTDANGCQAVASSFISVNPLPTVVASASKTAVCLGGSTTLSATGATSFAWSGDAATSTTVSPNATTTYTVTGTDANSCTNTSSVSIKVNALPTVVLSAADAKICEGSSTKLTASGAATYKWSVAGAGSSITVAPVATTTYMVTGTDANSCENMAFTSVTVNIPTTSTITESACTSFDFNGSIYTKSGKYVDTVANAAGCDSIITLNLTINTPYAITKDAQICGSATYTLPDGRVVSAAGPYTSSLQSKAGCDSIITTNLAVVAAYNITENKVICDGDTYKGHSTAGTYTETVTSTTGCDSTIVTILTVTSPSTTNIDTVSCGELVINGETYTSSGDYTKILTNAGGCGDTVIYHVTINQPSSSTLTETACVSYTLNGTTYSKTGTFYQTVNNAAGCDSVITLKLTIGTPTKTIDTTVCGSFTYGTETYAQSGSYSQIVAGTAGCDTTVTINVVVNQPQTVELTKSVCGSYFFNGQTITTSGQYQETKKGVNGCDSTTVINLTINQPTASTITKTVCDSYVLNDSTYSKTGTYVQTIKNAAGCDSTITLNLTIGKETRDTTINACGPVTFGTSTYSTSGDYIVSLKNAASCDSIINLHLVIDLSAITVDTAGCGSVTYNGMKYTTSGTYPVRIALAGGCFKDVTLNVTIKAATSSIQPVSGCGVATYLGDTYTASGSYQKIIPNKAGCDSVITVNVTINQATASTINIVRTSTYTLNGESFSSTGVYTQTIKNKAGCDSTITLNLTITDISPLLAAIKKADSVKAVSYTGSSTGQYPQTAYDSLVSAISAANSIAGVPTLTASEVATATANMYTAIDAFLSRVIKTVDKAALKAAIDSANAYLGVAKAGDKPGNYPSSAISTLTAVVASAQSIYDNSQATQSAIGTSTSSVLSAITTFLSKVVSQPNKTLLNNQIVIATNILDTARISEIPGDYPLSAYTALTNALASANSVYSATDKSQAQVDSTTTAITAAISAFYNAKNKVVDKTQLQNLIATAQSRLVNITIGTAYGNYPQSAVNDLNNAITAAQTVANNSQATASTVSAEITTLQNAITAFDNSKVKSADKTALNNMIATVSAILGLAVEGDHPGEYSAASIATLTSVLNSANLLAANSSATQVAVDAMVTTLNGALTTFNNSVIGQPSKVDLNVAIVTAQNYINTATAGDIPGNYPQSAINTLSAAIATAQAAYASKTLSQSEVNAATTALNTAITAFLKTVVGSPDKTALFDLIDACQTARDTVDKGDRPTQYSAAVVSTFNTAIVVASNMYNSNAYSQSQVDAMVVTLTKARETFLASANPPVVKTVLNSLIAEATALLNSADRGNAPTQYPVSACSILAMKIDDATTVYDNTLATAAEVNAQINALAAAIAQFKASVVPAADKTDLVTLIAKADSVLFALPNGSGIEALFNELAAAGDVVNTSTATQETVNIEYYKLNSAIEIFLARNTTAAGEVSSTLEVGPNPVSEELNVNAGKSIKSVSVVTMLGVRLDFSSEINGNTANIRFSGLDQGSYILIVNYTDGSSDTKTLSK